MKKKKFLFAAVILLITALSSFGQTLGDVNCNGSVEIVDALFMPNIT